MSTHDFFHQHSQFFQGKMTPLHVAASEGYNEVVSLLLKNGAQIDSLFVKQNKFTPVHEAARMKVLMIITCYFVSNLVTGY